MWPVKRQLCAYPGHYELIKACPKAAIQIDAQVQDHCIKTNKRRACSSTPTHAHRKLARPEMDRVIRPHMCYNDAKGKHLERSVRAEDVGMPNYRRNRVPGGTYFFTVNLRDRRSNLLVVEIAALRDAVRTELARRPFHIDAWVVLPDHMHCQWTLPEGDADFSGRMREIKAGFTRRIARPAERTIGSLRQRESGIWQRRFWEHTIRDERDYAAHMDYIHFNPVKHGLVKEARDWEYSSFRRCVAAGIYPFEWGGTEGDEIYGGERV